MRYLVALILVAACGGISASKQVRIRAAHDFKCDSSQLQTARVDDSTMRVTGCGQERIYVQECPASDSTHCSWVARDTDVAGKPDRVQ